MANAKDIRRFSAADLGARRARGESRTDLARVRAKTAADVEDEISNDPNFKDEREDWYATAMAVMPTPKKLLSLRLDTEVVDWFRQQGPGYPTRINAVLRAFVQQATKGRA